LRLPAVQEPVRSQFCRRRRALTRPRLGRRVPGRAIGPPRSLRRRQGV